MQFQVLTISQLNRYIKSVFDSDEKLALLFIEGEISNFAHHYKTGHYYFTLKDDSASIKAVMFKSYAQELPFEPQNGMRVLVKCNVSVYERDGIYQLYVYDMQPSGKGAYQVALEQLKARLSKEGLFDLAHKKPIPPLPQTIGVITSESGAAFQDIKNVLTRRYPLIKIIFCPAIVQGEKAAPSLTAAVQFLNKNGLCDLIIIGRGGGSAEDLWAFNDEKLARAIFTSVIPVISAVGHEVDYTICDFVADLRAPTPSAAAELAVPDQRELLGRVQEMQNNLSLKLKQKIYQQNERLNLLESVKSFYSPWKLMKENGQKLDFLIKSLKDICAQSNLCRAERIDHAVQILDTLNPAGILRRGYSITMKEKQIVESVRALSPGDKIQTKLADGMISSVVEEVKQGGAV